MFQNSNLVSGKRKMLWLNFKITDLGAGEIAQWAKCLACMQTTWHAIPSNPCDPQNPTRINSWVQHLLSIAECASKPKTTIIIIIMGLASWSLGNENSQLWCGPITCAAYTSLQKWNFYYWKVYPLPPFPLFSKWFPLCLVWQWSLPYLSQYIIVDGFLLIML